MFMESIFKTEFPATTLSKAYGIPYTRKHGGNLKFDGYNALVKIQGNYFKIAFEYDGKQHDEFPNAYHKTRQDFINQQKNDKRKDTIANSHNTIVIRIKKINGFDLDTADKFPQEIIKQFNSHKIVKESGIKLSLEFKLMYDKNTDSIKFLGNFI